MKLRAIVKAPSGRLGGAVMRQKGDFSTLEPKEEGPGTPEAPAHDCRALGLPDSSTSLQGAAPAGAKTSLR